MVELLLGFSKEDGKDTLEYLRTALKGPLDEPAAYNHQFNLVEQILLLYPELIDDLVESLDHLVSCDSNYALTKHNMQHWINRLRNIPKPVRGEFLGYLDLIGREGNYTRGSFSGRSVSALYMLSYMDQEELDVAVKLIDSGLSKHFKYGFDNFLEYALIGVSVNPLTSVGEMERIWDSPDLWAALAHSPPNLLSFRTSMVLLSLSPNFADTVFCTRLTAALNLGAARTGKVQVPPWAGVFTSIPDGANLTNPRYAPESNNLWNAFILGLVLNPTLTNFGWGNLPVRKLTIPESVARVLLTVLPPDGVDEMVGYILSKKVIVSGDFALLAYNTISVRMDLHPETLTKMVSLFDSFEVLVSVSCHPNTGPNGLVGIIRKAMGSAFKHREDDRQALLNMVKMHPNCGDEVGSELFLMDLAD